MKLEIEARWFAIWWGRELWTAIALERWERPMPFQIEKLDGEYTIDFRRWRVIFAPPWKKPRPRVGATA